jgi:hypothetical protein
MREIFLDIFLGISFDSNVNLRCKFNERINVSF